MKLGLLLHDPEEEHDCFSDNTHNCHYYDEVGMVAIWTGQLHADWTARWSRGRALPRLAAAKAPEAKAAVDARMAETLAKMQVIKETADSGKMAYDQMLAADNDGRQQARSRTRSMRWSPRPARSRASSRRWTSRSSSRAPTASTTRRPSASEPRRMQLCPPRRCSRRRQRSAVARWRSPRPGAPRRGQCCTRSR